jgi:glycosyltransferase involved in cell wall biosynthesis
LVHTGGFSGSAGSLGDALARRAPVSRVDLMTLTRSPRLLGARLRSYAEARREGNVPWHKTRAWSQAVQRRLDTSLVDASDPVLFVQTIPALAGSRIRDYAVYTDRTGLEGLRDAPPFTSRFSRGWLAREREFLRGAAAVFTMGPTTAASAAEDYGVPPERIRVVGAGPNMRLGGARPRTSCRRLLFVGVEWERKGGPTLLDAFARVRMQRPELELVVIGTDLPDPVPAGVRALGRVPPAELDRHLDDADVLVHPAVKEAFGIAPVEGLVKGLPCVHTDVSNLPWIVGDAGPVVPPDDPAALADAIRAVITDFPAYHAKALRRGEQLRREMSWDTVADAILRQWEPLPCGASGGPGSR